jgi:hypothetical protein
MRSRWVLYPEVRPAEATGPKNSGAKDGQVPGLPPANLFCSVAPNAGQFFPKLRDRRAPDYAEYLLPLGARNRQAVTIYLMV